MERSWKGHIYKTFPDIVQVDEHANILERFWKGDIPYQTDLLYGFSPPKSDGLISSVFVVKG